VRETQHPASQLGNALDLSAGLIAVGLLALSYLGESRLPRILLTLGFAFFVPGRAIVTNWRWSEVPMHIASALLS
jgi:hypothetical protein